MLLFSLYWELQNQLWKILRSAEEGKIKVYPLVHQKVVKDRSDFLSRDSISSPTYVSLTLLLVVTYVTRLTQDGKLWSGSFNKTPL